MKNKNRAGKDKKRSKKFHRGQSEGRLFHQAVQIFNNLEPIKGVDYTGTDPVPRKRKGPVDKGDTV